MHTHKHTHACAQNQIAIKIHSLGVTSHIKSSTATCGLKLPHRIEWTAKQFCGAESYGRQHWWRIYHWTNGRRPRRCQHPVSMLLPFKSILVPDTLGVTGDDDDLLKEVYLGCTQHSQGKTRLTISTVVNQHNNSEPANWLLHSAG